MRQLLHYLLIGIRDCIGAFLLGWAILFFETLFTIHAVYFDAFFFTIVMAFYFIPIERTPIFIILFVWIWSLFRGIDPVFALITIFTCYIIFQSLRRRVLRGETLWSFIVLITVETIVFKMLFLFSAILVSFEKDGDALFLIVRTVGIEFSWHLLANLIIGVTLYAITNRIERSVGSTFIYTRTTQRL